MRRMFLKTTQIYAITVSTLFIAQTDCYAFSTSTNIGSINSNNILVYVKHSKCSAPGSADFEGTDMSGVTPKCDAIFNACIDESLSCAVRKQKCREFDKMDRDGSCYKKGR